ncbi:hypothetical protein GCM10009824_10560 [Kocuria atrinae]|uniref:Uncharacterized protein n=1 Tax=Kocuria atrinae TaxID=592377 RepID=A0ABN2XLP5_9MICC
MVLRVPDPLITGGLEALGQGGGVPHALSYRSILDNGNQVQGGQVHARILGCYHDVVLSPAVHWVISVDAITRVSPEHVRHVRIAL